MKNFILLFLFGSMSMGCSNKDDAPNGPEGEFIVEVNMISASPGWKRDFFFKKQGLLFDEAHYLRENEESNAKYMYDDSDRLISVEFTSRSFTETFTFNYEGDKISRLTKVLIIHNDGPFTTITDFEHLADSIFVHSPEEPHNLFQKKYTFNPDGKLGRVEEYEHILNDFYRYEDKVYAYSSSGDLASISRKYYDYYANTGTYTHFPVSDTFKTYSYWENAVNPFYKAAQNVYMNAVLTSAVMGNGFYGGAYPGNFSRPLLRKHENETAGGIFFNVTMNEVDLQENRLPKSGNINYSNLFFDFQFTYE